MESAAAPSPRRTTAMTIRDELSLLTGTQRKLVMASFLGCALDAFDFFTLVFVLRDIAGEFAAGIKSMTIAILLTIAMRPVGALVFKLAADRFGWRTVLILDVLLVTGLELASGVASSFAAFLLLRMLYGVAMGGEWRLGAALSMKAIPERSSGLAAGVLQAGYPIGYLAASLALLVLYPAIGWRGMFIVAALPALLVLHIRQHVEESIVLVESRDGAPRRHVLDAIDGTLAMFVWAIVLVTALNFFGRGSDAIFPKFLAVQHGLSGHPLAVFAMAYNAAAAVTILAIGALSGRLGRRRAVFVAALVELPIIPIWVYAANPSWLATSALLMQYAIFSLQAKAHGAWSRSRLGKP
jgi:SHS family lactate transporter-like MFS transporter